MPHPKKNNKKPQALQIWHWYMGVTAAVFVLLLSVTGVLLNHTERLGLDKHYVQMDLLLDWYGIHAPETITSFAVDTRQITLFGRHLYLETLALPGEYQQLKGAATYADLVVVAVDNDILLLTQEGELVEHLDSTDGVPSGMRALGKDSHDALVIEGAHAIYQPGVDFLSWTPWQGDRHSIAWQQPTPLPQTLFQALAKHYRGEVLPMERVLLDLHSGRLLGRYGVWVMDAAAVLLIMLAFTGTWMWLKRRR